MAAAMLRVFPNPYAALDADGNLAGACPVEGLHGYYVGARLVVDGTDPDLGSMIHGGARAAKRHFVFDDVEVTRVEASAYYVQALRTGDLLPADAETAREVGLKFVPVAEALAAAKAKACAKHLAECGRVAACASEPLAGLPTPAMTAMNGDVGGTFSTPSVASATAPRGDS